MAKKRPGIARLIDRILAEYQARIIPVCEGNFSPCGWVEQVNESFRGSPDCSHYFWVQFFSDHKSHVLVTMVRSESIQTYLPTEVRCHFVYHECVPGETCR